MYKTTSSFAKKIEDAFLKKLPDASVIVFDEIDSTNTAAKLHAAHAAGKADTFFIAQRQSAGRGRLGRSFLSEEGGLYMSYLSYPQLSVGDVIRLTAYAAVALCETVREFTDLDPKIKWVNDCFVGDKKLAGILTEGEFNEHGSGFKYTVVGIGVNLGRVDFGELSEIATDAETECGERPDIAEFAVSLAEKLLHFADAVPSEYMQKYRELSMLKGRRVKVITPNESYLAKVLDVENDGSLSVVCDSGETVNLISGDVSIKLD